MSRINGVDSINPKYGLIIEWLKKQTSSWTIYNSCRSKTCNMDTFQQNDVNSDNPETNLNFSFVKEEFLVGLWLKTVPTFYFYFLYLYTLASIFYWYFKFSRYSIIGNYSHIEIDYYFLGGWWICIVICICICIVGCISTFVSTETIKNELYTNWPDYTDANIIYTDTSTS